MTATHIQRELATAYANLPHQWLELTEQEVDELGARLSGRIYNIRPPLPTFPQKDIQEELSRLKRKRFVGMCHE